MCLLILSVIGCDSSETDTTEQIKKASQFIRDTADIALEEISNFSSDDASRELKKLRQFEYRVFTLAADSTPEQFESKLNSEGLLYWDCFDVERRISPSDGTQQLQFFCKRRPDTPLKYVPHLK